VPLNGEAQDWSEVRHAIAGAEPIGDPEVTGEDK
jgi:hypothetical protein